MIEIKEFRKSYDGFVAVQDLSLKVEEGDICGFIGPNGAGKTTTMRFLSTLLKPTRGKAKVNGHDVIKHPVEVRKSIGFMPDSFGVYDGMQVWEYLDFFATAYNIKRSKRKVIIDDVLALLELDGKRDTDVNLLSRGMKQRLALARTLVHNPPVLILDEPASGLDPRARVEIKELLSELQKMGKTILISSHILSELADLCTRVLIIERGELIAEGPIQEILNRVRDQWKIEIEVLDHEDLAYSIVRAFPRVMNIDYRDKRISFEFGGKADDLSELVRELVIKEIPVLWCREVDVNLEEAFMTITKGEVS
ncbi:MAG: ABC transporter ATP-binding protein [Planctomycetota bacterium]|jgi:ABC-2 type transport system ATP-binding protein|nr:ABC transporter ATP-binding protein [Planctomycetota bacterium]MDP7249181.1 ABC transporter ATP-binding protein [Planctomycetota bacterium]